MRAVLRAAHLSAAQKLLLLALNAWPLLHLAGAAGLAFIPSWSGGWRSVAVTAWLLVLPPLACRAIVGRGLPSGEIAVPSAPFFRWWATWQLQSLFNRLPWIDEALRFVPGLYSFWLRLWGAKIGRLTLWSPGCRVFDRPLLRVGGEVVIGVDVRILGHFGSVDADGRASFTLGAITLGDRTTVGGAALLGPGFLLDPDQATETLFLGAPFTHWRAGLRRRAGDDPEPFSPPPS